MAAPFTRLVVLVKGVLRLVSGRSLLTVPVCQPRTGSPLCLRLLTAAHCRRPLHLSVGPTLSTAAGTKTDPQQQTRIDPQERTDTQNDLRKAKEDEEEYDEGPEYIPKRKASKNPMMNVGYAWMIGLPAGVIGFLLVKRQVDKNRLKQLKARQRMKNSNEGEYEGSRYRHHRSQSTAPKLDQ